MADNSKYNKRCKFIDDEAEVSGTASTDEDEPQGELSQTQPDHSCEVDLSDVEDRLKRTDSDQREFLRSAHDNLVQKQQLPPLSPTIIDLLATEEQLPPEVPTTTTTTTTPVVIEDPIPASAEPVHCKRFRIRSTKIALTYPQCPVSIIGMTDFIRMKTSKYKTNIIVTSMEDHRKTDGRHLHVYVETLDPINTSDCHFFDFSDVNCMGIETVYHPNIKLVKDKEGWLKYVCKDGNVYCYPIYFDWKVYIKQTEQHKTTASAKITEAINTGESLRDIRNNFAPFMLLHSKQVTQFYNDYHSDLLEIEAEKKWSKIIRLDADTPPGSAYQQAIDNAQIARWITRNTIDKRYQFRDSNLWIYGETKIGKTTLVETLKNAGCNICNIDYGTPFYDGLTDKTQLIVFDEYKAQRTITEMNKLCDGSTGRYNIKGGSFLKTKPIPVLVLSNFSIQEAYHNSDQKHLETLINRFDVIHVEHHILVKLVINQI